MHMPGVLLWGCIQADGGMFSDLTLTTSDLFTSLLTSLPEGPQPMVFSPGQWWGKESKISWGRKSLLFWNPVSTVTSIMSTYVNNNRVLNLVHAWDMDI